MVQYAYDAWGNHKATNLDGEEITDTTNIGHVNPIRYRSYYYDADFGFYYLNTRYYDPKIGRFINMDDTAFLAPDVINGLNLYAYCGNNPVMNVDPNGTFFFTLLVGALIGAVVGFGGTVVADYNDDGAIFNGSISAESYISNTLVGAAVGGVVGVAAPAIASAVTSIASAVTSIASGVGGAAAVTAGATVVSGGAIAISTATVIQAGIAAVGVISAGILFAEHNKNRRPSNKNKHQKGQTQRQREKYGGEKGDARRPYHKWKRNVMSWLLNLYLWGV